MAEENDLKITGVDRIDGRSVLVEHPDRTEEFTADQLAEITPNQTIKTEDLPKK